MYTTIIKCQHHKSFTLRVKTKLKIFLIFFNHLELSLKVCENNCTVS